MILTFFGSRDHWTRDIWFPIGASLKQFLYLVWLLRYCIKRLAKHIPVENAVIPIFCVLEAK